MFCAFDKGAGVLETILRRLVSAGKIQLINNLYSIAKESTTAAPPT